MTHTPKRMTGSFLRRGSRADDVDTGAPSARCASAPGHRGEFCAASRRLSTKGSFGGNERAACPRAPGYAIPESTPDTDRRARSGWPAPDVDRHEEDRHGARTL